MRPKRHRENVYSFFPMENIASTIILRQRLVLVPGFHRVIEIRLLLSGARFLTTCFLNCFISTAHDGSHVNTTQCHKCLEDDFDLCVNQSTIENCTNPATESCFSAAGRYKFTNGSTVVLAGVSRGCIACPSKLKVVITINIMSYPTKLRQNG